MYLVFAVLDLSCIFCSKCILYLLFYTYLVSSLLDVSCICCSRCMLYINNHYQAPGFFHKHSNLFSWRRTCNPASSPIGKYRVQSTNSVALEDSILCVYVRIIFNMCLYVWVAFSNLQICQGSCLFCLLFMIFNCQIIF